MALETKHKVMIFAGTTLFLAALSYAYRKQIVKASKQIAAYVLDKYQEIQLLQLHDSVRDRFRVLIGEIEKLGYKVIITSSYRTFEKQDTLYKADSRNAKPGESHHNFGFALDLVIDKDGTRWTNQVEWSQSKKSTVKYKKEDWLSTGIPQLSKSLGFEWGGEIPGYYDPIHFNIPFSMEKLRELAAAQFGNDPKKVQGNKVKIA